MRRTAAAAARAPPLAMADRVWGTSLMVGNIPLGNRLVSPGEPSKPCGHRVCDLVARREQASATCPPQDLVTWGYCRSELASSRRYRDRGLASFGLIDMRAHVEVTPLFSLRENAIAQEPGSSYLGPRRCVWRNWRRRNCSWCRNLSWLEWRILGASLLLMVLLATPVYASEALFACTIPSQGLAPELRAIRCIDQGEQILHPGFEWEVTSSVSARR
jgi:hypothetical protein